MNDVGYGRPPTSKRFSRGQSGNPKGRPKGRKVQPPYEAVLGRIVTIQENGDERRVTAAEAFLLAMQKRAFRDDQTAAQIVEAASQARLQARAERSTDPSTIIIVPMSVNCALQALRMATKLDRFRTSARVMLEPWIVTKALARLKPRSLTEEEQATVLQSVRTPGKVSWPDWWTVRPPRKVLR